VAEFEICGCFGQVASVQRQLSNSQTAKRPSALPETANGTDEIETSSVPL
jgi:hypothetical protein